MVKHTIRRILRGHLYRTACDAIYRTRLRQDNTLVASVRPRSPERSCAVTRLSARSTRPYVAGTDGGMTRWRREHRRRRSRGGSAYYSLRLAHTLTWRRARARRSLEPKYIHILRGTGICIRTTNGGTLTRDVTHAMLHTYIYIYIIRTQRREAAAGRIVRQLYSAESIMDIRTDGPPGPPSLPPFSNTDSHRRDRDVATYIASRFPPTSSSLQRAIDEVGWKREGNGEYVITTFGKSPLWSNILIGFDV